MSHYGYGMAAQVLRLLVTGEPASLNGNTSSMQSAFRIGAEACERVDEANQKCECALLRVAELEKLLMRAATILETAPLPVDGGLWSAFTLAADIRRALDRNGHG